MEVLTSQVAHLERVRQVYDAKFVHLLFYDAIFAHFLFRAATTALFHPTLQPPRCDHRAVSFRAATTALCHSLCFAPTAPRASDNLLTLVPVPLKKTEIESTQTS